MGPHNMNTADDHSLSLKLKPQTPCVAVDWGTSSLRIWSLSADGDILDRFSGSLGMSGLAPHDFERVLETQLKRMSVGPEIPAVICGMAGAAQGWFEAPYVSAPTALSQLGSRAVQVPGTQRQVHILPGIKQLSPANVMRGEETQLLGLLTKQPELDAVVCLPGTHSKWVEVRNGCVERFTTCMTGEIFGLLSEQSVLKHSLVDEGWDTQAFNDTLIETIEAPEHFANALFSLRADRLLSGLSSAKARARLSGLLVGIELAATRTYWEHKQVILLGDTELCSHYADALTLQSVAVELADSEATTLAGLCSAFQQRQEIQS